MCTLYLADKKRLGSNGQPCARGRGSPELQILIILISSCCRVATRWKVVRCKAWSKSRQIPSSDQSSWSSSALVTPREWCTRVCVISNIQIFKYQYFLGCVCKLGKHNRDAELWFHRNIATLSSSEGHGCLQLAASGLNVFALDSVHWWQSGYTTISNLP